MGPDETAAPVVLITGVMAAGKSSVAQHVAERLDRSVHVRGDAFRRMVVKGRAEMGPEPGAEALRQLMLRYSAAAATARLYSRAGFTVICQDVILGPVIADVIDLYRGLALHVVVLCPRPEVVARRERTRAKSGYGPVTVEQLQAALRATPRVGLWVDTSDQSVEETGTVILNNLDRASVVSG